jgi:hypothetical protein
MKHDTLERMIVYARPGSWSTMTYGCASVLIVSALLMSGWGIVFPNDDFDCPDFQNFLVFAFAFFLLVILNVSLVRRCGLSVNF